MEGNDFLLQEELYEKKHVPQLMTMQNLSPKFFSKQVSKISLLTSKNDSPVKVVSTEAHNILNTDPDPYHKSEKQHKQKKVSTFKDMIPIVKKGNNQVFLRQTTQNPNDFKKLTFKNLKIAESVEGKKFRELINKKNDAYLKKANKITNLNINTLLFNNNIFYENYAIKNERKKTKKYQNKNELVLPKVGIINEQQCSSPLKFKGIDNESDNDSNIGTPRLNDSLSSQDKYDKNKNLNNILINNVYNEAEYKNDISKHQRVFSQDVDNGITDYIYNKFKGKKKDKDKEENSMSNDSMKKSSHRKHHHHHHEHEHHTHNIEKEIERIERGSEQSENNNEIMHLSKINGSLKTLNEHLLNTSPNSNEKQFKNKAKTFEEEEIKKLNSLKLSKIKKMNLQTEDNINTHKSKIKVNTKHSDIKRLTLGSNSNINLLSNKLDKFELYNNIYNPNAEISSKNLSIQFYKYPQAKASTSHVGNYIKSFSVNSYSGIYKHYNEDKVSIILSITKPKNYLGTTWPNCSYLAIYDGHNGSKCSEFLRDKLHNYIVKSKYFPNYPIKALEYGINKADREFINQIAVPENDKSGSCANVVLIIDNMIYIANVGDSRCIASFNFGKECKALNSDHKPDNPNEIKRIKENGGSIYLSFKNDTEESLLDDFLDIENQNKNEESDKGYENYNSCSNKGVYKLRPGDLTVSRAFGDIDSKLDKEGNKNGILVCTPDIVNFDLECDNLDFIFMGCSTIFEKIKNEEVCEAIWEGIKDKNLHGDNIHLFSGNIVDIIIKSVMKRKAMDNVSCIFLSFKNYYKKFKKYRKGNNGFLDEDKE